MIKKLLQFNNQPLVVMFRESNRNCLIYAGGGILYEADRVDRWDRKGTRIDPLIAELTGRKCDKDTGIILSEFYSEQADPRLLAATLIQTINAYNKKINGSPLFSYVEYVTAKGYVMAGASLRLCNVAPKDFIQLQAPVLPKPQAGYDFRRENVIKAGWRLNIDQIKFYLGVYKDDTVVIKALAEAIKHKLKSSESEIKGLKQSVDAGANGTIKAQLASEINKRDTLISLRDYVEKTYAVSERP